MIKYLVTYVTLSKTTRRRMGKSRTATIDCPDQTTPFIAEHTFETVHFGRVPNEVVKVIDTRVIQ